MKEKPMVADGPCCPGKLETVTQLELDDGHSVGVSGLGRVFEQLRELGRSPEGVEDGELLALLRAERNYVAPRAEVEARYARALRRAFAAFLVASERK